MAGLKAPVSVVATSLVEATRPDEGVAIIRMADADGRNGFTEEFIGQLRRAFESAGRDDSVKVIVLCGLASIFCSGATLAMLEKLSAGAVALDELSLPSLLIDAPVPVIAAMQGDAVGGGFALGLAADIILMSESSRYGLNFVDLGLTPGMGVTGLAACALGQPLAHELMYTAEFRRGRDFRAVGLINHVLPKDEVMTKAVDLAARIAEKPRSALTLLKQTLADERRSIFNKAREAENAMHRICLAEPAILERIKANYVE